MTLESNFYFYIAFYENGYIRCFNTKHTPKPVNIIDGNKLIKIKKYEECI